MSESSGRRIIIVGAGDAGTALSREILRGGVSDILAGFVDDDLRKKGITVNDLPVLGTSDDIESLCMEHGVTDVFIAIPSAAPEWLSSLILRVRKFSRSINISIVPVAEKFFDNFPIYPSVRKFKYSDLLDRNEFSIDLKKIENSFSGKTVLITGAGGSIGSEICRQLLKFSIRKIVAAGRGENSIYNLEQSIRKYQRSLGNNGIVIEYPICDVKDMDAMERLFKMHEPDIVIHAAAHKHVPIMEKNEAEALKNNVMGTKNILELSRKYNVKKFVLISTDKAVRPTSVMGATKRIAELVAGYFCRECRLNTAIVRFGNVLGSRGSVIPLFHEQIRSGGPVTVTDPEMTRYFMSIEEASLLVINAASLSNGGEIFVLDMGKQYRIRDIARRMIELNGYIPEKDIAIEYIGLRPGEKLYEELFYDVRNITRTENDMIYRLVSDSSLLTNEKLNKLLNDIIEKVPSMSFLEIREFIKEFVPEYAYTP